MTTRGRCHAPGRGQNSIVTARRPLRVSPAEVTESQTTGAPVWTSGLCLRVGGPGVITQGRHDDKVHKVTLTMKLLMKTICKSFVLFLSKFCLHFRTTKRTISITSLHHNDQVPLYTRGHDATSVTQLEDVTTAYPSLDRETLL